jgi:hypothetical protein
MNVSQCIDDVLRQLVAPGDLVDARTIKELMDLKCTSYASSYLLHESKRGRFELVGKMVSKTYKYRRGTLFVWRVTDKFFDPRTFRASRNHCGGAPGRTWECRDPVEVDVSNVRVL